MSDLLFFGIPRHLDMNGRNFLHYQLDFVGLQNQKMREASKEVSNKALKQQKDAVRTIFHTHQSNHMDRKTKNGGEKEGVPHLHFSLLLSQHAMLFQACYKRPWFDHLLDLPQEPR